MRTSGCSTHNDMLEIRVVMSVFFVFFANVAISETLRNCLDGKAGGCIQCVEG